ncbi:MAG TPA: hypothetical protein VGS27_01930 [Candidatus Sulfotelmatobacter sp.]|nr:hypothetical protein [Candidatus Sulfotelmatobacter sp.]
MKSKVARRTLGLAFAASLAMTVAASAQSGPCSMARAAGSYSFTDNGTVLGVGLRTAVGVFTLDAAGNITNGSATSSLNGTVAVETFSGTYTVNPDCTGSGTAKIFSSGVDILNLTMNLSFDNGLREMRAIFTSLTAEPGNIPLQSVISLNAVKQ